MVERKEYDVVIIGAGPGGLGAGMGALRGGAKVLVIEKQPDVGLTIKGETIHKNPRMEEILGSGFFERHEITRTNRRRYYSPTDRQYVDRVADDPNIIFSWPELMADMTEIAMSPISGTSAKGLEILFDTEVTDITRNGKSSFTICSVFKDEIIEFNTRAIIGADGYDGITSRIFDIKKENIDHPILKLLMEDVDYPDIRLEYYLDIMKGAIPASGFIFPRGEGKAEVGMLLFTQNAKKGVKIPEKGEVYNYFENFIDRHPVFRSRIKDARETYRLSTSIPMGGFIKNFIPTPGVILVGDAAGQVECKGGSGIASSFLIGHHSGQLIAGATREGVSWSRREMREMERRIRAHPYTRRLRRYYRMIRPTRALYMKVNNTRRAERLFSIFSRFLK